MCFSSPFSFIFCFSLFSQEESSLSDEISNSSDDDELTEMESTATDLLKLLEFNHKDNNMPKSLQNNFENSSMSTNSNNYYVKLKNAPQQNTYSKPTKSKSRHSSSRSQGKKQIINEELKMKKQQKVEKSLDSDSSEENSLSYTNFNEKLKKNNVPKRQSASPSKTRRSSLKRKCLSPTKGVSLKKQKSHNPEIRKSQSPSKIVHPKANSKNNSKKEVNVKKRVRSISNADTRSVNNKLLSENASVPVTRSNKASKKSDRRDSSPQNKKKEVRSKSTKSTAEKKKKEIWSDTAKKNLKR